MTDPAYHAAFHAMCLALFTPTPTGTDLVRGIVAYAERGAAEREVAARALRDIYCCDGSAWDAHDAGHWFDSDGNVDVRSVLSEAGI